MLFRRTLCVIMSGIMKWRNAWMEPGERMNALQALHERPGSQIEVAIPIDMN